MIEQRFDLNLIPDSAPVIVHADQYDTGSGRLVVSLYDGDVAYIPASGATVRIQGTKPDGKGFLYDATISGNVVTADLTEQMSAVAGDVRTQIVVRETSGRTGTFVFFLRVQKSALPSDADMSESDLQAVERMIEAAEGIVDEATEAASDAEAWAVGERGGVPVPSSDPSYQNNAAYWASVAALYSQGALKYQGSIPFSALPTSGMSVGDFYNITTDFTTDSRFAEGAGIKAKAGTNIAYDKNGKWDLFVMPVIPTMTATEQGIGRPDGMTADVTDGVFRAKGVAIYSTVNASGTEYGADWLKYGNTVITPSNIQLYLVYIDGKPTLWGWDGTQYVMVSASGSGGLVSILQADFDALPTADKNDPEIWWWISDADGLVSSGGAGGGVTSYTDLTNKPQINGVELTGNKTAEQLGITKDTTPTSGSANAISSGGVYDALKGLIIARQYLMNESIGQSESGTRMFAVPVISGYTPLTFTHFNYRNVDGGDNGDMDTYGLNYKPMSMKKTDWNTFVRVAYSRQVSGDQERTFYFDMGIIYIKSEYFKG